MEDANLNKEAFKRILKEFIQVMIFLAFLGGMALWFLQDYQKSRTIYSCDAEQVENWYGVPHFIGEEGVFSGGLLQSEVHARSGTYSLKLEAENPFGFETSFESLRGNEIVSVSVWRYTVGPNPNEGQLLASIPGHLYEASIEGVESDANGWQKLSLWIQLDAAVEHKTLKIYCWNPAKQAVWYDDMRIEIIRNP